jgi:uncharacterized membrane protein YoaK (UPF0700 family)
MTDTALVRDTPPPRWVPALLSFVAGYIDSYTFLALFGLFVAQVTGSFVTAGAELVSHDIGIAGKMIAIAAFAVAAALTAGLIRLSGDRNHHTLPWMLAAETLLIAVFCLLMLTGPQITGANDWHGVIAGSFAAAAMGSQSVIVRLLMRGVPQTNVMTGNMTQLSVETIDLLLISRRHARDPGNGDTQRELAAVRSRLGTVLAITAGFILGAALGAICYAKIGLAGAPLAIFAIGGLALWAIRRGAA